MSSTNAHPHARTRAHARTHKHKHKHKRKRKHARARAHTRAHTMREKGREEKGFIDEREGREKEATSKELVPFTVHATPTRGEET